MMEVSAMYTRNISVCIHTLKNTLTEQGASFNKGTNLMEYDQLLIHLYLYLLSIKSNIIDCVELRRKFDYL